MLNNLLWQKAHVWLPGVRDGGRWRVRRDKLQRGPRKLLGLTGIVIILAVVMASQVPIYIKIIKFDMIWYKIIKLYLCHLGQYYLKKLIYIPKTKPFWYRVNSLPIISTESPLPIPIHSLLCLQNKLFEIFHIPITLPLKKVHCTTLTIVLKDTFLNLISTCFLGSSLSGSLQIFYTCYNMFLI